MPSPIAALATSPTPAGCTAETARSRVRPSLVQVINERGGGRVSTGTGYAVAAGDRIVTNEHVINGAVQLTVVLPDGRRMPARVLRADEGRDLALLDVPGAALPAVRFRAGTLPTAGQRLFALGFPQSAAPTGEPTLTSGTLVAVVVVGGATFLQTDVPASIGNSGGPLLTPCGEVVGTVSSGMSGAPGVTFASARGEVEALLAGAPPLRLGAATPAPAGTPGPVATSTPTPAPRPGPAAAPPRTPPPVDPPTAPPSRRDDGAG